MLSDRDGQPNVATMVTVVEQQRLPSLLLQFLQCSRYCCDSSDHAPCHTVPTVMATAMMTIIVMQQHCLSQADL
jgi:hypothetical protein